MGRMCGIAGVFHSTAEPVSPVILKRMTDAIAHRGPDGEGHYYEGSVGLGHRRLAILDRSPAGHQPMMTDDHRFVLSFNGEIYNFLDLRLQLERLGHHFHSRTDTEVVLHSFEEWGIDCLSRFNGMFAFAVWDKREQTLYLARDRYGVKPLYYAERNGTLAFGSEIKAILAHPEFRTEVDREALVEYFTFQNFFTPRTLFKGVQILPAGHYLALKRGSPGERKPVQYWDFDFREEKTATDEREYLEELDRLFAQAVSRQLVSDVDVGTYLSGGMDSGSIAAIAAKQLPYMKSFTVGFDLNSASGLELGFDERETAEFMSYRFKTEHYEMVLKAGDMERAIPRLVKHLEEPRVGQSYPNFYAAQLASKFVKVVLTGAAGDELFGGYPWRYYRAVVNDGFEGYVDKYYAFWQRLIPNDEINRVFSPIAADIGGVRTRDIFKDVFRKHAPELSRAEDYVNHSLYFEAKTFLHGLLVVEDKVSMAHGLESRVPFLDNDLVDFAQKLPVRYKLGNLDKVVKLNENEPGNKSKKYFEKTRDGKLLLRKAMQLHIPEAITKREKQGFSAPDASWFRGESIDYVRGMLGRKNARIFEYMDYASVQSMLEQHYRGEQNRRLFIWSLINFETWLKTFA